MGWNTTIVVLNDALSYIEQDPDFGKNLSRAVREQFGRKGHVDIPSLNHCNAASVIEQHHADGTAIVTVGGNCGIVQHQSFGWHHHQEETQLRLCREWAEKLGYRLSKIPGKKG